MQNLDALPLHTKFQFSTDQLFNVLNKLNIGSSSNNGGGIKLQTLVPGVFETIGNLFVNAFIGIFVLIGLLIVWILQIFASVFINFVNQIVLYGFDFLFGSSTWYFFFAGLGGAVFLVFGLVWLVKVLFLPDEVNKIAAIKEISRRTIFMMFLLLVTPYLLFGLNFVVNSISALILSTNGGDVNRLMNTIWATGLSNPDLLPVVNWSLNPFSYFFLYFGNFQLASNNFYNPIAPLIALVGILSVYFTFSFILIGRFMNAIILYAFAPIIFIKWTSDGDNKRLNDWKQSLISNFLSAIVITGLLTLWNSLFANFFFFDVSSFTELVLSGLPLGNTFSNLAAGFVQALWLGISAAALIPAERIVNNLIWASTTQAALAEGEELGSRAGKGKTSLQAGARGAGGRISGSVSAGKGTAKAATNAGKTAKKGAVATRSIIKLLTGF